MAPLSPDTTKRYWVDYKVAGFEHTIQMRTESAVVDADAGATLAALFAAMDSQLLALDITGFRVAESGTSVSNPATWPGDASYGSGAGDPYQSAQYYDFVGRGAGGRRVRVAIFGTVLPQFGGDYRMTAAESTIVADVIAVLTSDVEMFLDISGFNPVWHNYANLGVNAYWRNKIR